MQNDLVTQFIVDRAIKKLRTTEMRIEAQELKAQFEHSHRKIISRCFQSRLNVRFTHLRQMMAGVDSRCYASKRVWEHLLDSCVRVVCVL